MDQHAKGLPEKAGSHKAELHKTENTKGRITEGRIAKGRITEGRNFEINFIVNHKHSALFYNILYIFTEEKGGTRYPSNIIS